MEKFVKTSSETCFDSHIINESPDNLSLIRPKLHHTLNSNTGDN